MARGPESRGRGVTDHSTFEVFYTENYIRVLKFVERRIADRETAREVAAEVFVVAWRKFDPSHPPALPWLYSTARNLLGNAYSKHSRGLKLLEVLHERALTAAPDPEIERLDHAMSQLAEKDREAIRLTYWEELTAAEVGTVLGCSEQAAWKRISRAKASIKRLLLEPTDRREAVSSHE